MRTIKASLLTLGLVAAMTSPAAAQLRTFDDITTNPIDWVTSYNGLSWSNAFVVQPGPYMGGMAAAGGFQTALQSGDYVLGNASGGALGISGGTFNLLGGVFSSAWFNNMSLNVTAYSSGTQVWAKSFLISRDEAQWLDFGINDVDNVVFTTSGGELAEGSADYSNRSFAADNFDFSRNEKLAVDVVPEPMTISLMGAGLLAVGFVGRRRRAIAK